VTRVYADMVGDLFHFGHAEFLRRARAEGDELVVGVHADADVARYKHLPVLTMEERIGVIETCRFVDRVLPNAPLQVTKEWIARHGLDLVVHGDDFDDDQLRAFYGDAIDLGILRVIPYTPEISSTEVIERVGRRLAAGDL
jgi:cytidyltransferase-like protein